MHFVYCPFCRVPPNTTMGVTQKKITATIKTTHLQQKKKLELQFMTKIEIKRSDNKAARVQRKNIEKVEPTQTAS